MTLARFIGDAEFSRKVHDPAEFAELLRTLPGHDEPKSLDGGVVKPMVFGGLDGIITTFAVVAGAIGADLTPSQVLIMGFCNLIADGFSMGFGEYTSGKAEMEYALGERRREEWELENYPEGEMKEMVEVYKEKGISEEDACRVIPIMAKYKDFFVDHMMVEELGLLPPDMGESPAKQGLVMFTAFVMFGSIPLLGFMILMAVWGKADAAEFKSFAFGISCALTAMTLLVLGGVKAVYTKQPKLKSSLMMLANGAVAGFAAWSIGEGLNYVFN
mmetsp:Transcript_107193/g.284203  ORF Transcript_107193/g.284203 Transcript_107193/m.284203 type:complete len:273 (-) Transcript_107193:562-1380(-)